MVDKKNNNETEQQQSIPTQGSGSILAAERKKQKKTVEEVSAVLNLSATQIRTIELDQTEGLPEPTYVRGYIRSYAKLLGLEPDDVLKHYLNPAWQQMQNFDDMPRNINIRNHKKHKVKKGKPVTLILLVIAVATAAASWYSGLLPNWLGVDKAEPVAQSVVESGSSSNDELVLAPVESPVSEAAAESNIETAEQELESTEQEEGSAVVEEPQTNTLKLTFSETTWVDIRDANDKRLAYKNYVQGETLDVSSETPLSVFIGNASGVTVQYNSEPFDITSYQEGVYAKFVVGQ